MSPYRILIAAMISLTIASSAAAQGGMGGAPGAPPGGGGAGIGAPRSSMIAVNNAIDAMQTQLNQMEMQLGSLKVDIAEAQRAVETGREPAGQRLPGLKAQAAQIAAQQEHLLRQMETARRLKILASPVDVSLKSARMRQAAQALTQASRLTITVDAKVPEDIRVNAESQNVPLGAVLEVIAHNAGLIIAPSADYNGVLLRLPGKLVVDGTSYSSEGGAVPWSEDWGMAPAWTTMPIGRKWQGLFDIYAGGYGMTGMPMMGAHYQTRTPSPGQPPQPQPLKPGPKGAQSGGEKR